MSMMAGMPFAESDRTCFLQRLQIPTVKVNNRDLNGKENLHEVSKAF